MDIRRILPLAALALLPSPLTPVSAAPAAVRQGSPDRELSPFSLALDAAERALGSGEHEKARALIQRALERDAKSTRAWALRARWAEATGDTDELVYSLHTQLRLATAQRAPRAEIALLRERLAGVDPIAPDLLAMKGRFVAKLLPLAQAYEKDSRPHSAIRVYKEVLALDPDHAEAQAAIERVAAAPDPSLAEDAKPVDLLADVSEEWIREHDAQHSTWDQRARMERENYITHTDAGYEVLVRSAEAMEQMNAFYREFFQYGTEEDRRSVTRIALHIFKSREEYLERGIGPPVEWSGGHFTGGAVETYIGQGGFESMTQTLFHEAAHQFVSLATNASGWLNEGLASFFEGTRILANGTVIMNMPANHRLFPLVERMERGWMSSASDGIDPQEASTTPEKAPTFRIVLENEYSWGPPWYAPTWGVVYFLYNYQDPVDGRYVYRDAFREFVDKSGGRVGKGAVRNFEEVVLANPKPPIKGVERGDGDAQLVLPRSTGELDPVWKQWLTDLRDEQTGRLDVARPWLRWARCALLDKDWKTAQEHFEKGLVAEPGSVELNLAFAEFLAERKNTDRATKLVLEALRVLESREPVDEQAVRDAERLLARWDPKRSTLESLHREIRTAAAALVGRYREAGLSMMVMDLSWRMGTELQVPELFASYEAALRESGRSLAIWELAYNEKNLEGWDAAGDTVFRANGSFLDSEFGEYAGDRYDFQMLTLDEVTSGDFSLEADVLANRGEVNFCGLVFGRKDAQNFHALIFFPGKAASGQAGDVPLAQSGWVDLATFYGGGAFKTWRHNPVELQEDEGKTSTGAWHRLRIDVAGRMVDTWVDGELIASQEFLSLDVLRGRFGLITGPGQARFKDVRFMARHPRDPAGRIERAVRMEELARPGEATGGSWRGQVPPWPVVGRWVQEPRESWKEAGPVPQVLVLWSIQQNDIIPIDGWLRELADRWRDVGLRVVAVTSPNDEEAIDAYLAEHPFPGSVAVDFREGVGIGDTNKLYSTPKFNLPRLLLLDLDQRVAWEGDPGFTRAEPWYPGYESFLDTPLSELVSRRKLASYAHWRERWTTDALPALSRGDLETALPVLLESREYDRHVLTDVHDARLRLSMLESALADLVTVAGELAGAEREPALPVLIAWAELVSGELDRKLRFQLKPHLDGTAAKHWERALKQIESFRSRVLKDPAAALDLASRLSSLEGAFPREIAERLSAAAAANDAAALQSILDEAPVAPKTWLVREHFGWR